MGMTHLQYIISFRSLCVALLLVSGIAKARAAEGSYIANTSVYDTERGFVHPGGLPYKDYTFCFIMRPCRAY